MARPNAVEDHLKNSPPGEQGVEARDFAMKVLAILALLSVIATALFTMLGFLVSVIALLLA